MATRRDKKLSDQSGRSLRNLFLFSLCEEIHKKFTTHQEKHRNLMKLYISHIILLTIKTCAPLVEGEMLNTIEKRDCGWKQEKTFLQQQLFFFLALHFQLLIVFKKQFSRRIFRINSVHLIWRELYLISAANNFHIKFQIFTKMKVPAIFKTFLLEMIDFLLANSVSNTVQRMQIKTFVTVSHFSIKLFSTFLQLYF